MKIRNVAVLATAALLVYTPLALAANGHGKSDAPPMLTLNHLSKNGGPVVYVDWDGRLWHETNGHEGLQRQAVLDGAILIDADSAPLLP